MPRKKSSSKKKQGRPQLRLIKAGKARATEEPITIKRPPKDMPPQGRSLWKLLAPELQRLGLLNAVRLPAFYGMCLAWGLVCDAVAILREEGYTVPGTHGTMKKHPALTLMNEQLTQFRHYARVLGLLEADLIAFADDELEQILEST